MRKISQGESLTRYSMEGPDFDWERWTCVDASRPIISGHSLGGSAAVSEAVHSLRSIHKTDFL